MLKGNATVAQAVFVGEMDMAALLTVDREYREGSKRMFQVQYSPPTRV